MVVWRDEIDDRLERGVEQLGRHDQRDRQDDQHPAPDGEPEQGRAGQREGRDGGVDPQVPLAAPGGREALEGVAEGA